MVEYIHDLDPTSSGKQLKVAPDNIITIKPVKESWNREEVKEIILKALTGIGSDTNPIRATVENQRLTFHNVGKWIEQNL